MKNSRPIGIFDSGVGGLTLANEITKAFPSERLVFFGDTAHLPYGDKSSYAIKHYSEKILEFFLEKGCNTVVIACNTASSIAFNHLFKKFGDQVTLINVIDPVIKYCLEDLKVSNIGVIGTKGTIRSRAYPKKFHTINPAINITTASTPLLAPMIEEGFYNNNISQTIINAYLSKKQFNGIQAMILACTHYPLIKEEVKAYYKGKVHVIDNTDATVSQIKKLLANQNWVRESGAKPHEFYVSDYTKAFQETAKIFFGESIRLMEKRIMDF